MSESGKRPYYSYSGEKQYPTFIRTVFAKALWDRITSGSRELAQFAEQKISYRALSSAGRSVINLLKQSELKKPYEQPGEDYQNMEAEWEGLPGLQYPKPGGIDQPWNTINQTELGETIDCLFDITCEDGIYDCGYCSDSTVIFNVSGTNPFTQFIVQGSKDSATKILFWTGGGTNNATVYLYAGPEEWGQLRIYGVMSCGGTVGESNINIYPRESDECPWFYLTLERGDGTDVDESLLVQFDIKGSSTGNYYDFSQEYLGSGQWLLKLTGPNYDPSNKYWIRYAVQSGDSGVDGTNYWNFITQYPGRIYSGDWYAAGDAIAPGIYSDDEIPFFCYETEWDYTFTPDGSYNYNDCASIGQDYWYSEAGENHFLHMLAGSTVRWECVIKSSIPYRITVRNPYQETNTSWNAYGSWDSSHCVGGGSGNQCGITSVSVSGPCGDGYGAWRNGALNFVASDGLDSPVFSPMGTSGAAYYSSDDIATGETSEPDPLGLTHSIEIDYDTPGGTTTMTFSCDDDPDPYTENCVPVYYYFNNWALVWGNGGVEFQNSAGFYFDFAFSPFGVMQYV